MNVLSVLLSFQPEFLSSINVIFAPRLGGVPLMLIAGALFVITTVIGMGLARRRGWKLSSVMVTAAAIAWLPLLTQGTATAVREFSDTWFMIGAPEREQVIWRYCRIDKYQNLGGSFCALYPFVEKVREQVPAGSSLALLTTNLVPYFNYYLYDSYRITSIPSADYLVVYRPQEGLAYKDSELSIIHPDGRHEVLGSYEVVAVLGMKELIFKKTN